MSLKAHVKVSRPDFSLDVELDADEGETVAVLGPNGAGKTTLLRALAGLVAIEGRVQLDGEVLEDSTQRLRVPTERRQIGLVFQDHVLFPHLTVLDNVAFGLQAQGRGDPRQVARRWLERFRQGHPHLPVIVVEDACAAGSDELHRHELEIINMIYCHVMSSAELLGYLP